MVVYIKPKKKAKIIGKNTIKIKDVADVYAPEKIQNRINSIKLLSINKEENKKYLVSVMDIIKKIEEEIKDLTISNVGETDTIIEYEKPSTKIKNAVNIVKVFVISIMVCIGSATAIMSFHSDAQLEKIFQNYYYIFFNRRIENPMIIELPYSIGLAMSIIIFFNHFSGKKATKDPTPIEVELTTYETQVLDNLVDTLGERKEKENGSS